MLKSATDDPHLAPDALRVRLRELQEHNARLQQWAQFLVALQRETELQPWAHHVVSESQRYWTADRAGLLVRRGRKCRLIALTGADSIQRRSESVRRLERLAAGVAVGGPLYPTSDTTQLAPQLDSLLTDYLEESAASAVCLLPLTPPPPDEEAHEATTCGVLLLEWYGSAVPDCLAQQTAPVAAYLARRLEALQELERLPLLPAARMLRALGWQRGGKAVQKAAVAAICLLIVAMLLAWIPAELTVTAPGRIEPVVRADLFAPADAIVVDLPAAALEHVEQDQVLVELRSPELDRKWNEVWGQLQTTEQSLAAARAARLQIGRGGEAIATDGYATQEIELTAVREGLLKQVALLEREQQALTLRSPLPGRIVSWDLRQLLARPVRHGERLVRVVDPEGPWQLKLAIPEERAGHVLALFAQGQPLKVTYMLEAAPIETYEGRLTRLAEVATLSAEGTSILEACVEVERPPTETSRPDGLVRARIHCGQRSLGYVWFHRVAEAVLLRTF